MRAHSVCAAWEAVCDHDPSRNVPLAAFIYRRVITGALTRYRQEWSYARHSIFQLDEEIERASIAEHLPFPPAVHELLRDALMRLTETQRQLIGQLFGAGYTETEVAQILGISHQAISKRKQAVLRHICARLGVKIKKSSASGCKKRRSPHFPYVEAL